MIQRLCIIGTGLIGGSLARALRAAGFCNEIIGAGRDAGHLKHAVELGVIDTSETDIPAAVKGADMVVVAVPLGAMEAVFKEIKDHLADDAVLTDVGSAKGSVIEAVESAFGEMPACFVPGHPIAGTEKSGVEISFSELFTGHKVILTPTRKTNATAVERVRSMWEAAGAEVVEMSVKQHDTVLAATSHLPHLLAYTLVDTLAGMNEKEEVFRFAAGGFRDFTRIASSDPTMWRDICMANSDAVLKVLKTFSDDLDTLADAIRAGDADKVFEIFQRAKLARDQHVHNAS